MVESREPGKSRTISSGSFKINAFRILALVSFILAVYRIVWVEHFYILPLIFFVLGFLGTRYKNSFSCIFLFLLPLINSTPALFPLGYPHNYMSIPVFLLSGMAVGMIASKVLLLKENWDEVFDWYLLFLMIMVLSAAFLFLRWSNLTIPGKSFGHDTPVSPTMERVSFGSIFPVVTLFLYCLSPLVFFYFRKIRFSPRKAFKIISAGFATSVAIAVFQKIFSLSFLMHPIDYHKNQYNGGFSDFNSLGFFSGFMFLWSTQYILEKKTHVYMTFFVSLAGIIVSGSRASLLFVMIGFINFFLKMKSGRKRKTILYLVVFFLLLVMVAGGTLLDRLAMSFIQQGDLPDRVNKISSGRLWMTLFSLDTIGNFYFSGIGTGNFIFFLNYRNFRQKYVYDLTLNQYLQVFTETGFWGFLFFIMFLITLFLRSTKKLFIGSILVMLLLNNYFWFPEILILFWIVAALYYNDKSITIKTRIPLLKIFLWFSVVSFVVANGYSFSRLHPLNWAKEKGTRYDYGFWLPEKDPAEKTFRWTKGKCGLVVTLNEDGTSDPFEIGCGAPLRHLPKGTQRVTVFWKGKEFRTFNFRERGIASFKLSGKPLDSGFLELRINPPFSLKKMNLGNEERSLGVQFFQN